MNVFVYEFQADENLRLFIKISGFFGLIYVARILHSQNNNYNITVLYSKIWINKLPSGKISITTWDHRMRTVLNFKNRNKDSFQMLHVLSTHVLI